MFSDSSVETTGFGSSSETERMVSDGSCQTVYLKTCNQETQTAGMNSTGTQAAPKQTSNIAVNTQSYDAEKLLKFLNRVLPHLEEELKTCEDNFGFNDVFGDVSEGKEKSVDVYPKQVSVQPDFCEGKIISCLSWNSTGMLLAVASSEKGHLGWCGHESCVGVYNTDTNKCEKSQPKHLVKVSACIQCIQFHPYIPSLLGGGLHSGEVVVWDLTNEEVMMTKIKGSGDEAAHVDAITCLTWSEDRNGVWLVTTGRDGRIIFWKVTRTNLTYEPHQRFLILKHHLTTPAVTAQNKHLEVLNISFWPHVETDFIIAAGGGAIFHCSLATAKLLSSDPGYEDPVRMGYKPHEGIVTCVACVPASDTFASCGTDREIHVYKSQTVAPLFVIHTDYAVLGLEWANGGKRLISWGCPSTVESRKMGEIEATTVCDVGGGVSAVSVNSKRQGRIAVGSQTGRVLILSEDGR